MADFEVESLLSSAYVRAMIYGDPGVGKTPMIATGEDTLILDADNGTVSAGILGSSAKRKRITDWDDMEEAKEYMRMEGYKKYKWWWLDSVTLFQDRGLDHIMEVLTAAKAHRHRWAPDKGEYGQNMNRLMIWLREAVEIPTNFGMTAHVMRTEVEEITGEGESEYHTLYMPHVQGKNMPGKVCGEMNVVGYMYAKQKEDGRIVRYLRVSGDEYHYCKDRFGALGNSNGVMVSPSIPKIEQAIADRMPKRRTGVPAKKATKAAKVARKATTTARRPAKKSVR